MKNEVREYRSFQIEVAPVFYGCLTALGAFVYFLTDYQWWATYLVLLLLIFAIYVDKPFRFILMSKKIMLFSILSVALFMLLPGVTFVLFDEVGQVFTMILIPVVGIVTAVLVYHVYNEDSLKLDGWVNISKKWE